MNVLAIDPGPHVGVATWLDGEHKEYEVSPDIFYANAIDWVRWADVVVCEAFFIGGSRAQSSNETIEMIGVLRYLCSPFGARGPGSVPFTLQAPADAKNFSTREKLTNLGWWKPAANDHARSASRHLLLYLSRNRLIDPERLIHSPAEGGQ